MINSTCHALHIKDTEYRRFEIKALQNIGSLIRFITSPLYFVTACVCNPKLFIPDPLLGKSISVFCKCSTCKSSVLIRLLSICSLTVVTLPSIRGGLSQRLPGEPLGNNLDNVSEKGVPHQVTVFLNVGLIKQFPQRLPCFSI